MEGSITKQARAKIDAAEEPKEEEAAEASRRSERALDHIAELWVEMAETEAFQLLEQELGKQATRHRQTILDEAFAGKFAVNQRDIDYDRGLHDGLHRARVVIETARRRLERKETRTPETAEEEVTYW